MNIFSRLLRYAIAAERTSVGRLVGNTEDIILLHAHAPRA